MRGIHTLRCVACSSSISIRCFVIATRHLTSCPKVGTLTHVYITQIQRACIYAR